MLAGGTPLRAAGSLDAPWQGRPRVADVGTCVVRTTSDGDTLRCADGRRVRLLGIDAPELDQAAGSASRGALQRLLRPGQRVRLETDVQRRDPFGRTLAYVWIGPRLINEEMVRGGFAVTLTYAPNVRYVERLRRAQATARAARAGLWASNGFSCLPLAHRQGRC